MVSHIRLENTQNYKQQVCLSLMTGLYGCKWKRYQRSTDPTTGYEKAWIAMATVCFAFITVWLYYWVMAQNDLAYFNRYMYYLLGSWFDWYMLLYILTILTLIYVGILLILAMTHFATGRQLYLHWVHKVPLVIILAWCVAAVIVLTELWNHEWTLVAITLQVTAPIIQIVAIVILTVVAWPLAGLWWRSQHVFWRCLSLALYIMLLLFVYLTPLIMQVPCVIEREDLPRKPPIMAHAGAEQIAPENTIISFQTAVNYSVYGFETDVRISLDGVPFLMHDSTLARTTNVDKVFPNRTNLRSESFTWAELQQLDAGSWFLERDPHNKLRYIPKKTQRQFVGQKIPSLASLLQLSKKFNKSVLFDLQDPPKEQPFYQSLTEVVVKVILDSKIPQNQIWWVSDRNRTWVENKAPGFVQTAQGRYDVETLENENIANVNVEFTEVDNADIRLYNASDITTNIYVINTPGLYSIYWCTGVHTVTSVACQDLYNIQSPVWHMTPVAFVAVSISLGVASALCVIVIFFIQGCRNPAHEVNPESISLHSPRHFTSNTAKKSDRELLYHTNEDTTFSPTHAAGKNIQMEEEPPVYQDDLDAMGVAAIGGPVSLHQEVKMQLE